LLALVRLEDHRHAVVDIGHLFTAVDHERKWKQGLRRFR
jgi:hypothetical protein